MMTNDDLTVTEAMKRMICEGDVGPTGLLVEPYIPTLDLSPEDLRPEHLDELNELGGSGLIQVDCLVRLAQSPDDTPDLRWWLQWHLLNAMNNGVRMARLLDVGLDREILMAYPSSPAFSGGGVTCGNAHRLAAYIALETVSDAWSVVCSQPVGPGTLCEAVRSPVRMRTSDTGELPLFMDEQIPAVLDAIRARPGFNAGELVGRMEWEKTKVWERRGSEDASTIKRPAKKKSEKWTPTAKTKKVIRDFKRGEEVDYISLKHKISAANARKIRSRAIKNGLLPPRGT